MSGSTALVSDLARVILGLPIILSLLSITKECLRFFWKSQPAAYFALLNILVSL